ncbi:SGNH/GDSL hydrolase family protein [Nakamurella alba]|nr:SGNH/GDSL hydrolase family protein [Nakamurella alba]
MSGPRDRRRATRRVLPALVAAVGLLLAACSSTDGTPTPAPSTSAAPEPFLTDVTSVAAMGDSITAGVNACGKQGACAAASWATGSDTSVMSLSSRIASLAGSAPAVYNEARPGIRAAQLGDQLDQVVKTAPGLVVILAGANDACRTSIGVVTGAQEFGESIGEVLDTISTELPDTHIFITSIPDLPQLVDLFADSDAAHAVWSDFAGCASLLQNATSTDKADVDRRAAIGQRIVQYNAQIEQRCQDQPRCTYDGGAVHAAQFSQQDISTVDYFHPSETGQGKLAEVAWQALLGAAEECAASGRTC